MNKYACCDDHDEGIKNIDATILFCWNHSAGPKYTAPSFKFCPWCGKMIERNRRAEPSRPVTPDELSDLVREEGRKYNTVK